STTSAADATTTTTGDDAAGLDDGAGDEVASGADGERAAGSEPCDVITTAVLAEAFPGVEFGAPSVRQGTRKVQEVTWTTSACHWGSPTLEGRAAVAGPEGFEGGFQCVESPTGLGEVTPVDEVGEQGWWSWDDFSDADGNLAVCAGEVRVDVDIDGPP